MYLNGNRIGWVDEIGTVFQYETFPFQSTPNLKKGDEIWLEIAYMSTGPLGLWGQELWGNYIYNHFSVSLLEEKIEIV